jgi:hypothetical protein
MLCGGRSGAELTTPDVRALCDMPEVADGFRRSFDNYHILY